MEAVKPMGQWWRILAAAQAHRYVHARHPYSTYHHNDGQKVSRDACREKIDWHALCAYASSLNNNKPCKLLDQCTAGGVHLIRILEFAARCPVPKTFGYELDDVNNVRAAFVLMEFIAGSSAIDASGGYEVHRGRITVERRSGFYREMASIQVHLSSIRLPKIGTVIKHADNTFGVGPLPGLGGPFSTATECFIAWAKHSKFPLTDDQIHRRTAGSGWSQEILDSIHNFPLRLRTLASKISVCDNGPFPLYHPDLYQSNIIVNSSFQVLGVIDWEGVCTVPWEVVQPPIFLTVLPRAMDDPDNYTADGEPKDRDTVQLLAETTEYAQYVRHAEQELKTDQRLSTILLNPCVQGLSYALKVYLDPGKMGFYCSVLESFTSA
ncbi:uncharacterized protein BDW70DRAFT_154447 [Aspergillus foveolatus]|uniref:uncharacterized protein n=1 Tax=Aspergillus foveolatus TaxID=210207 RepID=UPI003CCD2161